MNSKIKRILCFALAFLTVLGVALPALAATTTITNQDNPTDYFEYYGSNGAWNDLNTPYHYDASGNVAYCIEHEKDPPSSSGTTYNDFDPSEIFSGSTVTGIQAILDHGYPASSGGLSSAKAHYATANAIRAWIRESAGQGYNFMLVSSGYVRAKSGYEDVWSFFQELLGYARSGFTTGSGSGGEIIVSAQNLKLTWQVVNGQLQTSMTVQAPSGYTIQPSHSSVQISGYTGGTSDSLTITAPMSLMGTDVTLYLEGKDGGTGVTLYWYEPSSSSSKQSVVVAQVTNSGNPDSGYITITGEFYSLTVKKVDSYTGAALDGAVFQLTRDSSAVGLTQTSAGVYTAGGNTTQFTTNNGMAVISSLPGGAYQLVEVSAPSAAYTASAASGINLTQNASVTVQNAPTELDITKTDKTTGAAMANVTFTLLDSAGSAVRLSKAADGTYRPDSNGSTAIVTDANGKAKIMYLPKGKYTLRETVPAGYAPQADGTINLTGKSSVSVTNEKLVLDISKTNGYTGKAMAGIPFTLLDSTGAAVKLAKAADGSWQPSTSGTTTFVTDANGKAKITGLTPGRYTVRETPLPGYAPQSDKVADLTSKSASLSFVNAPLAFSMTKVDSFTGKTLAGVAFTLLDSAGNPVKLTRQGDGVYHYDPNGTAGFVTGADGKALILYIPAGSYILRETTETATGYAAAKDVPVTVTNASGTDAPATVRFQNDPITLEFNKSDALTKEPLDGGVFQLKDAAGAVVKLKQIEAGSYRPDSGGEATFTTKNGEAVIRYLTPQQYTITEVTPPKGYKADTDKTVTVTAANDVGNAAKASMQDQAIAITFTKTDALTNKAIDGGVFTLLDKNGKAVKLRKVSDGVYTPDADGGDSFSTKNGTAKIGPIDPGTYTIRETKAPAGFTAAQDVQLTVTDANTAKNPAAVTVENKPLALSILKQDGVSGAPLEGVTFKLTDKDGKTVSLALLSDGSYRPADAVKHLPNASEVKPDANGKTALSVVKTTDTFTTDAQGKAKIEFISQGKYKLVERQQSGYVVLEGLEFEITSAHTREHPLQYTVSNVPTRLLIEKQCGVTKTLLTGATFQLKDKDGKIVKLTLQKDGTYQPAKEGENGVESFPVNDKGQAVICYLPAGAYTVTELIGPVGYAISAPVTTEVGTETVLATSLGIKQTAQDAKAEDTKDETAAPAGRVVGSDGNFLAETSLSVVDLPLALKISKVHAKTQKPLAGAAFQLKAADKLTVPLTFRAGSDGVLWYDAKGSVTTIQMDKNAEALIYGLPAGKYQLEETVVPTNFFPAIPQNIEIAMTNTSEAPKEVVVVNTPTVKLGIDSDKFNVVIAIALTVLIGGGLAAYTVIRRKRGK